MASFLFSNFFNDAGAWTTWNPDCLNTLMPLVGNAAAVVTHDEHDVVIVSGIVRRIIRVEHRRVSK